MKKLLFSLFGLISLIPQSAWAIGGLFIQNTNTLQQSATCYLSSGTVLNFNTNVVKFPDGSTQVTAALSSATLTGLKTSLNLVPITVNTSTINFDSNGFTNSQSPTSVANIGLNPNATYFVLNSNSLNSGTTFYVSSGSVKGSLSIYNSQLQALLMPSTTEAFRLVNVSSHQVYILIKSSGTTWWKVGSDVTNAGTPEFDIYNATTGIKDIAISTNDVITIGGTVALSPLTASRPVKLNSSKQLTSALIDVTADITGTVPSTNLPSNVVYTNTQQTISASKVFTSSQSFLDVAVSTIYWSNGTIQTSSGNTIGNAILNQNTLQSGSTFYVSSGTVNTQLRVKGNLIVPEIDDPASNGKITLEGANGIDFYPPNAGVFDNIGGAAIFAGATVNEDNVPIVQTIGVVQFMSHTTTSTALNGPEVNLGAAYGTTAAYDLRLPRSLGSVGDCLSLENSTGNLHFSPSSSGGGGLQLQPATTYVNVTTFSAVIPGVVGGLVVSSTRTQIPGSTSITERQSWELFASSVCVGPETQFAVTGQYQDFCSISLDPGLYLIQALYFGENGGGTNTQFDGAISKESGNNCGDCTSGYNLVEGPGPVSGAHQETLNLYLSTGISVTTRFYLKGYMNFSGAAPYLRSSITAYKR